MSLDSDNTIMENNDVKINKINLILSIVLWMLFVITVIGTFKPIHKVSMESNISRCYKYTYCVHDKCTCVDYFTYGKVIIYCYDKISVNCLAVNWDNVGIVVVLIIMLMIIMNGFYQMMKQKISIEDLVIMNQQLEYQRQNRMNNLYYHDNYGNLRMRMPGDYGYY